MQTIHIRLDDAGGNPWSKPVLESVYASGMDFEPDERRQRILPDGTVELTVTLYGTRQAQPAPLWEHLGDSRQ